VVVKNECEWCGDPTKPGRKFCSKEHAREFAADVRKEAFLAAGIMPAFCLHCGKLLPMRRSNYCNQGCLREHKAKTPSTPRIKRGLCLPKGQAIMSKEQLEALAREVVRLGITRAAGEFGLTASQAMGRLWRKGYSFNKGKPISAPSNCGLTKAVKVCFNNGVVV
jgi:hypothetical protein